MLRENQRRKQQNNDRWILPHFPLLVVLFALVGGCAALAVEPPSSTRVALVTGANKGIGKEIVRMLMESSKEDDDDDDDWLADLEDSASNRDDWIIFLGSRDQQRGELAVQELLSGEEKDGNSKIICCQLDLTDKSSIVAGKEMVEKMGGGKLDVLINNAAICFNDPTLYGKCPYTPFEKQADITIRTNFFGTLCVTGTFLPLLQKSSSPRIINIASSAGRLAILKSKELVKTFTSKSLTIAKLELLMKEFVQDVENGVHASKGWPNTCYGMSKLGIIALTKILAREHPNIMVNAVDPGYCATDQNNNQGVLPAQLGAVTPMLLATLADYDFTSGAYFYQDQEITW
jgi:carbonyl reductase 1